MKILVSTVSKLHLPKRMLIQRRDVEQKLYVGLLQREDNVSLIAVEEGGGSVCGAGYILGITNRGILQRFSSVSDELGLQLDETGRIRSYNA